MLKVIVDRTRWYRGKGSFGARLRISPGQMGEDTGKMCCLGFACLKTGLTKEQIEGFTFPSDAIKEACMEVPKGLLGLINVDSNNNTSLLASILANINDNTSLNDNDRELELIKFGKEAGIKFTFVN